MRRADQPLRIAHVHPISLDLYGHDDLEFGTRARYLLSNLAAAQARMGDRPVVHLLTSGTSHRAEVDGAEVVFHRCIQPPRRTGVYVRFARQLAPGPLTALRRETYDVVHFHGIRSLHAMFAAVAERARRVGLPLVGQDHGPRPVGRIARALEAYGLRRTDIALAGNAEALEALAVLGVPRSALHLLPSGVDSGCFHPAPRDPPSPGRPFRILVVSRLSEDKDPLTMAHAAALLAARGRRFTLEVIGTGPLQGAVERRLREGGVDARFTDHVAQTELGERYRAADALLLTSLSEGSNQLTIEALSCGLPVVASDIPGIRENARGAGGLVPPRDAAGFADALERLMDDPDAWRRCRERGLENVRGLDWDTIAGRLREIYTAVIGGDRNGRVR